MHLLRVQMTHCFHDYKTLIILLCHLEMILTLSGRMVQVWWAEIVSTLETQDIVVQKESTTVFYFFMYNSPPLVLFIMVMQCNTMYITALCFSTNFSVLLA